MDSLTLDKDGIVQASPEELETVSGGASTSYRYYLHKVVRGDTLGKLANKYGSTIDLIFNANDIIKDKNLIKVGWKLIIPVRVKK